MSARTEARTAGRKKPSGGKKARTRLVWTAFGYKRMKAVGTKAEVFHGKAVHTSGGLKHADLMRNKRGKIVSVLQHEQGLKAVKNIRSKGYFGQVAKVRRGKAKSKSKGKAKSRSHSKGRAKSMSRTLMSKASGYKRLSRARAAGSEEQQQQQMQQMPPQYYAAPSPQQYYATPRQYLYPRAGGYDFLPQPQQYMY